MVPVPFEDLTISIHSKMVGFRVPGGYMSTYSHVVWDIQNDGFIKVKNRLGHPPYGTVKEENTSDIPRNTGRSK